ncbi:MAG: cytochrome c oxidase subunit IV [Microbacterium sp. 71-36]|uniref:cytochrome c oxidase subunit 4 n=1 Tax=unclassified Microbacterium TaxID=2609290 RepID=UPI00086B195C|nr:MULTISPECIES: cytochrome c oxidase subunit 4 [unclassified Microbacterium]MBN9212336.1 cytochrome c oxidase subunit 4 [Microbacterium sp.]ODT39618.1 MAG: cytochrome c oxidase subunit IV [Microbacterium sp. SCN 71-17]OJV75677.1 MAG: cytochrome c oxidase subunit IV [Microbacterium sp. 71-36]
MRTNVGLWWLLTGFAFFIGIVYAVWNVISHGSVEWVGTVALIFMGLMSAMIAFYIGRVVTAQRGELPEDSLTADIDDGDPEMGEFSPWSWWPIVLAGSAAIAVIGLAVGSWLVPVAFAIFAIAIVGWVYEYYRGYFAR